MHKMTRRSVVAQLGAITALMSVGCAASAFEGSAGREIDRLLPRIDELAGALRGAVISVDDWRTGIDDLFSKVAIEDVLTAIDFDRMKRRTEFADLGVSTTRLDLGLNEPWTLNFLPKLFAVDTGRSIIPHGHSNMVSAHLPLTGAFRLRQYDQVSRDDHTLMIRPTHDRVIAAGDLSSIGEIDDNVHWFIGSLVHWFIAKEPAFTFDVIVTGLDEAADKRYEIFNLDMEAAREDGTGLLRVPKIGVAEALKKYG